jgi:hypothetical protein
MDLVGQLQPLSGTHAVVPLMSMFAWTITACVITVISSNSMSRLPPMRQQLLDPAVELGRQPRQHVAQIGPSPSSTVGARHPSLTR